MASIVILARGGSIHHAIPLQRHFAGRCVIESDWRPSAISSHDPDIVITFDEHGCDLGLCIAEMSRRGAATLLIMDGILEWRRTWEYPTSERLRPLNQPILSHKVACLGNSDARILESWGNVGKCEVVGCLRFDSLIQRRRETRIAPILGRKLRLLVMTAKTPGFTQDQVDTTLHSLCDLKSFLSSRCDIEVTWRLGQHLHKRLGVRNSMTSAEGGELHSLLNQMDAVITTPSTAMLESMLAGIPVAILDYHNTPHYVNAAWCIGARDHVESVVEGLKRVPLPRMLHQEYCLHDAVQCRSEALPRMALLIEEMIRVRKEYVKEGGKEMTFPHRILADSMDHVSWPSENFNLEALYPSHPVFGRRDITHMQAEVEAALGTVDMLNEQVVSLTKRLYRIPFYSGAVRLRRFLKDRGWL